MNDPVFAALLRSELRFFVWKSFHTILPGTTYLPNWHIDAIVYQLMRVKAGEVIARPAGKHLPTPRHLAPIVPAIAPSGMNCSW